MKLNHTVSRYISGAGDSCASKTTQCVNNAECGTDTMCACKASYIVDNNKQCVASEYPH